MAYAMTPEAALPMLVTPEPSRADQSLSRHSSAVKAAQATVAWSPDLCAAASRRLLFGEDGAVDKEGFYARDMTNNFFDFKSIVF